MESVANPVTANPGSANLQFVLALNARTDVACWLALIPAQGGATPVPTPQAAGPSKPGHDAASAGGPVADRVADLGGQALPVDDRLWPRSGVFADGPASVG